MTRFRGYERNDPQDGPETVFCDHCGRDLIQLGESNFVPNCRPQDCEVCDRCYADYRESEGYGDAEEWGH